MGSYRKGLLLSLGGIVQTQVDLHSIIPARRTGLRNLCPEHMIPVHQAWKCSEGNHPVEETIKGAEVPEGWRIVNPGDKPRKKAVEALELTPVPAQQLEDHTVHGSGFYYCQPSTTVGMESWAVLHRILSKGKVALVARGALRADSEKIWRLDVFRDYLVLQELVFPEEIRATPETVDVKVSREVQKLVDQFIEQLQVEWDKFDSSDKHKQAVQEWLAQGELVETDKSTIGDLQASVAAVIDLQAALKEAVKKEVASK